MDGPSFLKRTNRFVREAHTIFAKIESSKASRTHNLSMSYEMLDGFTAEQDDTIRQALRCAENALYRAAHVMAWSATIDYLESYAASDSFIRLNSSHPKWNIASIEDLRDRFSEFAIVEGMKKSGYLSRVEMKAFHGLLSKRNECAHPTGYYPDLNQTLGYISEIHDRLGKIEAHRGK